MDAKIGDRVSLDGKKIGQPRRTGVIRKVSKGLSGIRYQIAWDDGHESVLAPGAGNLTVERSSGNSKRVPTKAVAKPKKKAKSAKRKPARRR